MQTQRKTRRRLQAKTVGPTRRRASSSFSPARLAPSSFYANTRRRAWELLQQCLASDAVNWFRRRRHHRPIRAVSAACNRIVTHAAFEPFIMFLIFVNTAVLALDSYPESVRRDQWLERIYFGLTLAVRALAPSPPPHSPFAPLTPAFLLYCSLRPRWRSSWPGSASGAT